MIITVDLDSYHDGILLASFSTAFRKQAEIIMKIEDQEVKMHFGDQAEEKIHMGNRRTAHYGLYGKRSGSLWVDK